MGAGDTQHLIDRVVEAYGGARRWTSAEAVSASVRLGGQLFRVKQVTLPSKLRITTQLERPHTRLDPIDPDGTVGVLDGRDVHLETRDGAVVDRREDARASLPGPGGMGRSWDRLDLTYFLGYAFWGYNALVRWLLRDDVEKHALGPDELELTLPEGTPAHCRTQRFSFDARSALLRRNDYRPEVVAPRGNLWVANRVLRHGRSDGLPYPSRRRVKPRPAGRWMPAPTFVAIDVAEWRLLG